MIMSLLGLLFFSFSPPFSLSFSEDEIKIRLFGFDFLTLHSKTPQKGTSILDFKGIGMAAFGYISLVYGLC